MVTEKTNQVVKQKQKFFNFQNVIKQFLFSLLVCPELVIIYNFFYLCDSFFFLRERLKVYHNFLGCSFNYSTELKLKGCFIHHHCPVCAFVNKQCGNGNFYRVLPV